MKISVDEKAKQFLLNKGTDIKFGARPLKRAIQKYLDDELAELLLDKQFASGETIDVSFDNAADKLTFSHEKALVGQLKPAVPTVSSTIHNDADNDSISAKQNE